MRMLSQSRAVMEVIPVYLRCSLEMRNRMSNNYNLQKNITGSPMAIIHRQQERQMPTGNRRVDYSKGNTGLNVCHIEFDITNP